MGRACRIVNEPPPNGCNDAALLAAALLLLLHYDTFVDDSEESDEEGADSISENGNDGRKAGQPGSPQPQAPRAPIASIEEIDGLDEPGTSAEPPGKPDSKPKQQRHPWRYFSTPRRQLGNGTAAPAGGQKKQRGSASPENRLGFL
ncbi:uncharacterized protein LOC144145913 [Haemaphysalis longicornis]